MNAAPTNGGEAGHGWLSWFTPGVARWLLMVYLATILVVAAIVLVEWGNLDVKVAFGAIQGLVMLVVGGLLPLMGARQMADAKDKTGAGETPPAPPGPAGS